MNPEKLPADTGGVGGGSKGNMIPLPLDFIPGNYDVLCGRGKKNYNSLGNQRLRRIVESYVEQYSAATSRQDKSDILSAIVNEVRSASANGGFIKQDPASQRWFEVGDFLAREKVSQAFRDALAFQYRSSKKFKHEKRRQRDKAAKLAKQKGEAKEVEVEERKSPAKSPPTVKPLLQKKQSLTVLREEPMAPHAFVAGQGNVSPGSRPSRAMSTGHAPAAFLQDTHRQAFGGLEQQPQQQQQATGPRFGSPFNNHPGAPGMQDNTSLGTRHTSWPLLFPAATNPLFNPLQAAGAPNAVAAAMSHRCFSDTMMTDMNQSPFHQFHQSDPNPQSWSQLQQEQPNAAFHASFPGYPGLSAGTSMMPTNSGMSALHHGNNPMATASMTPGARVPQEPAGRKGRMGRFPVQRSASNVSTGGNIVAHLESSMTELDQDENPFEPVPLLGAAQAKDDDEAKGDDDSIHLPHW